MRPTPTAIITPPYTEYETNNSSVPFGGVRVRRQPSLCSDQVGSIPFGGRVRISRIVNGWGKLHPSMHAQLQESLYYRPHNLEQEVWTIMESEGRPNYLIVVVDPRVQSSMLLPPPPTSHRIDNSGEDRTERMSVGRLVDRAEDGNVFLPTIEALSLANTAKTTVTLSSTEGLMEALKASVNATLTLKSLREIEEQVLSVIAQRKEEIESELLSKEFILQSLEIEESKLCVVCQDSEKVIAMVPCGHICLCEVCANQLPSRRCPICNTNYSQCLKIFQ